MSLLYENTLSGANMRQSMMPSSGGPLSQQNMADTLPPINFGFEELRERMAKFTTRFDAFIAEGRKRLLDERNEFRSKQAELGEDHKMKERGIEILAARSASHAETIAKEQIETTDMINAIDALTLQRDAQTSERDRLREEIAATQKLVAQRIEAQKAHNAKMDAQARYNLPELDFWTDYLCMRIDGVGRADELRFVFTHIDNQDWEREASFELMLGEHEYRVERCKPKVDKEKLAMVVDKVNEGRNLALFLKEMRELFVEAVR